ncbi:hypothetical protein PhaeoP66_03702 [Phaeobacter inhibens]|uniref:Uncharacterized protein n=1 Tax=Phaeobacter inhibens TaxID=221822 RepID=A0ABN5GSX8_9RHOB|nr:hypothetical protein [Phaeobacter inhibens]AUQ96432.1 hypothetical protein PhaeoP66_03702 [Phaeobacter inhibens]
MMAFEPIDPIGLRANMPRIDWICQHVGDTLLFDLSMLVAWEVREAFKEAFYFGL